MDIKRLSSHLRPGGKRKKGDTAQLAAQLAPLEEQDKSTAARQIGSGPNSSISTADGAFEEIIVDNEGLNVPKDIMEEGGEKTFLGMEPVVLVILGAMLAFIAFMAWQVSQMPPKKPDQSEHNSLDLQRYIGPPVSLPSARPRLPSGSGVPSGDGTDV